MKIAARGHRLGGRAPGSWSKFIRTRCYGRASPMGVVLSTAAWTAMLRSATEASALERVPITRYELRISEGVDVMDEIFWKLDDIERLIAHPDRLVRDWALDQLNNLYPDQGSDILAGRLCEEDTTLLRMIVHSLSKRPDAAEFEQAMLDRFNEAGGGPVRLPGIVVGGNSQ